MLFFANVNININFLTIIVDKWNILVSMSAKFLKLRYRSSYNNLKKPDPALVFGNKKIYVQFTQLQLTVCSVCILS